MHEKLAWNTLENFIYLCLPNNFINISRSLSVVNDSGYKLFTIQSVNKVEEIFASDNVDTRIAERLFSSSLVATVLSSEQNKLKVSKLKDRTRLLQQAALA